MSAPGSTESPNDPLTALRPGEDVRYGMVHASGMRIDLVMDTVRVALEDNQIVFCPTGRSNRLARQLNKRSTGFASLALGFDRVVVLDARHGLDWKRSFRIDKYYRHVWRELCREYDLPYSDSYHEEDIVQVLRDEAAAKTKEGLICLINMHLVPLEEVSHLRGLTQERHKTLIVYRGRGSEVPNPRPEVARSFEDGMRSSKAGYLPSTSEALEELQLRVRGPLNWKRIAILVFGVLLVALAVIALIR